MSHSTNTSVLNFCDVCNLSFESKKGLYRHQSYDLKHKELLEKIFESEEEISERMYNSDEDDYIIKTKAKTENNIYSKIRSAKPLGYQGQSPFHGYECKECHEEFRNKIALTTHSYSHNRKYLENTEDFSQNTRVLYYRYRWELH